MFDARLFKMVPDCAKYVAGNVAARLAALAADAAFFFLVGWLFAALLQGAPVLRAQVGAVPWGAAGCVAAAAVLVCARFLFLWAAGAASAKAQAACRSSVRSQVYGKLLRLGPSYGEHITSAGAYSLMGEGTERLAAYAGTYAPQLFYGVLAPLCLFAAFAAVCVPAAVVMLAFVVLIPVVIATFMRRAKAAAGGQWEGYVDLGALFLDAIRGITTLKVFRADGRAHERLNEEAEKFRESTMRVLSTQLNAVKIMELFSCGGAAAGTCIVVASALGGQASMAGALAIVLLAADFFAPMRRLGSLFHMGMNAQAVMEQVGSLMDVPEPSSGGVRADLSRADVVCKGLGYSYDGSRAVLQDVDFQAGPGSFVGITGESGSGKSTLAKVITGRYASYTGSVRIAGVELRDMAPEDLHAAVTLVSSESHLFKGSVRSNLEFGCPDADDADMWNALHRCRLDTFVVSQGGLDCPVDEGGANLSGGQRQRLRAARAILHDTPIYVFDEATSNIDAESEKAMMDFIQELSLTRTVVVASHRLMTLAWTDRIYVLEEGRVAQRGVHARLAAAPGPYGDLWLQQRELEEYAQQTEIAAEAERMEDSAAPELEKLIANMPDKVASVVRGAYDAREISQMITGSERTSFPLGHPSWIPIDGYGQDTGGAGAAVPAEDAVPDAEGEGAAGSADPAGIAGASGPAAAAATAPAGEAASEGERGAWNLARRLMAETKDNAPLLRRAIALGVLAEACSIAVPVGGAALLVHGASSLPVLVATLAAIVACGALRGPLAYRERLATHDQTFRTLALLRDKVFGAMRRLAPARLEQRDSGDLLSLVTTDVELLEQFYARTIAPVACAVVVGVVMCVLLCFADVRLALLAAAAYLLVGALLPAVSAKAVGAAGRGVRSRSVAMGTFMMESLDGLQEILQYGWADERMAGMQDASASVAGDAGRLARISAVANAAVPAAIMLLQALFAAAAMQMAAMGQVGPAAAAVAAIAFCSSFPAIQAVSSLGVSGVQMRAAAERIVGLLDQRPQTPEIAEGESALPFTGAALHDVDFSYAAGGDKVLDGLNLDIPAGRIVRVAGPSGTGKSTLVKLLMRFWDPSSGMVEVSGHDARRVATGSLREAEGYMTQDTRLFQATLRENIAFVKPGASEAEIGEAVEKASLSSLVARLPEGLDTLVGDGAAQLSDGELQRVGLARMFLYDAPFMLLDEPTSNLDSLNEAAVLMSLARNRGDKTVLIVSHRPSASLISDVTYVTRRSRPLLTMGRII